MIQRGSIYWADLGQEAGSKPAKRRPVLVIQSAPFNASRLHTTVAAVITSSTRLAAMPGNVFLPADTVGKADLGAQAGRLPAALMDDVDRGLRRVLGL